MSICIKNTKFYIYKYQYNTHVAKLYSLKSNWLLSKPTFLAFSIDPGAWTFCILNSSNYNFNLVNNTKLKIDTLINEYSNPKFAHLKYYMTLRNTESSFRCVVYMLFIELTCSMRYFYIFNKLSTTQQ